MLQTPLKTEAAIIQLCEALRAEIEELRKDGFADLRGNRRTARWFALKPFKPTLKPIGIKPSGT